MTNKHPHNNVIKNIDDISYLITILNDSKIAYVKKNLSIHLHEKELSLIRQIHKHTKPHHKNARIRKYKALQENPETMPPKYDLHLKIYTNHYKKLEKKGIITLDLEPETDLPYDMEFTDKGLTILKEIATLEKEWEDKVLVDVEDKEELLKLLQDVALNAMGISYAIQKQVKGVY